MMTKVWIVSLLAIGSLEAEAAPALKAACTLTTVEAIVREIGGDRVDAFSLSAGDQDPHFVSPTPVLMKRVRDLAIACAGRYLESRKALGFPLLPEADRDATTAAGGGA